MRRPIALAFGLSLGSCFNSQALWGEPCEGAADCGPDLTCHDDRVCADARACDELEFAVADLRPRVVLLLDHSESMKRCLDVPDDRDTCVAEGEPAPSRWDALAAVVTAIVSGAAGSVDFAAIVLPSDSALDVPTGSCNLDDSTAIAFGPDAAAAILAAVPRDELRAPEGENPMRAAWKAARALLDEGPSPAGPPAAIILFSDNPPNCTAHPVVKDDLAEKLDADVLDLVEAGAQAGLRTLVVGISVRDELAEVKNGDGLIDGVNPHDYFSALADAGGAPQPGPTSYIHLADTAALPATTDALLDGLDALTADLDACRVRLAAVPDYPDLVALELDERLRRADPTCADDQAWRFQGDSAVELCPGACARLHAGAPARLRFGCP